MERIEEPGKAPEVRIAELEKLTGRLRIGLILIGSLILYQGTWEIGLLGPVRVYAFGGLRQPVHPGRRRPEGVRSLGGDGGRGPGAIRGVRR